MYTLVLNEKGECEVVWCTANETFYLDNKTTSPYAVHSGGKYCGHFSANCRIARLKKKLRHEL